MSEILSIIDVNDYGIQSMVAGAGKMQNKTATPTTSQQLIEPDQGYDGMSSVTVNAVTSAIDENIIPTNIRSGKTILGVQGNLEPDKPDQNKTVTPSTVQQVVVADTGYELAQVTVEAVPDETPELNAQDTLLGNQETLIGQLSSALDDKIALDLADATSDANATANDIAKNKTAYVNGVKLTGTMEGPSPDWSEIGYSDVPQALLDNFAYSKDIYDNWDNTQTDYYRKFYNNRTLIYLPGVDCSNATGLNGVIEFCQGCSRLISTGNLNTTNVRKFRSMFNGCGYLTDVSLFDTSSAEDISYMFYSCNNLKTIPQFNTLNVTSMNNMFYWCSSLTTIPILNTSSVTNMDKMFYGCDNLSNESLNNILQMCINAIRIGTRDKRLNYIGLSSTQATTCQTLSNWNDFVNAGWSTGYES